ncbi:MAG: CCA tRNA nucleotidyltransferase [Erysipelotrichales bacterium]|nr:CCA tRNA nucleotidyltransferase [Erysipelotrichales bacterium]
MGLESGIKIIKILENNGYEAFFVGGAVRDYLLKREIKDIDITTNCLPDKVLELFKGVETGKKYGCVTVFQDGFSFEVTTYRFDGKYIDSRHPNEISFASDVKEDIARRDFTVNALLMDKNFKVYDYVNGLEDLKNKMLRAVGNHHERFKEDALRLLRAIYFAVKLGFTLEEKTFAAIKEDANLISKIVGERVILELKKIFEYGKITEIIFLLQETNLAEFIPNLKVGITKLINSKNLEAMDFHQFMALIFYLNHENYQNYWRFSNKEYSEFNSIFNLAFVTKADSFNNLLVYTYGKKLCLTANKINRILYQSPDQSALIEKIDEKLPIKKTCELKFKGGELISLYNLKGVQFIGAIVDDIKFQVINHILKNDYQEIKTYVENKYLGGVLFDKKV